MTRRAPTSAELAKIIGGLSDGPERARLEDCYHAKNVDRFGPRRAGWYRDEYRWLRSHATGLQAVVAA